MKTSTLVYTVSISLLLLVLVRHSSETKASEVESTSLLTGQCSGVSPWFHAAPRLEIIDDRPQVCDLRQAPEQPQTVQLPLFPINVSSANGAATRNVWGTASYQNRHKSSRALMAAARQSSGKPAVAITAQAVEPRHASICRHLLGKVMLKEESNDRCTAPIVTSGLL